MDAPATSDLLAPVPHATIDGALRLKSRQPKLADLETRRAQSIPRMMYAVNELVMESVFEGLKQRGHARAAIAHGVVLRNMDFEGSPLSVIARRAGVTRQAVAKVTAELVELGYVRTVTSPDDGRVKIAKLTARGRALARDGLELYEEVEAAFRAVIGPARLEILRKTMSKLAKEYRAPAVPEAPRSGRRPPATRSG